jgi:hypothetical protein
MCFVTEVIKEVFGGFREQSLYSFYLTLIFYIHILLSTIYGKMNDFFSFFHPNSSDKFHSSLSLYRRRKLLQYNVHRFMLLITGMYSEMRTYALNCIAQRC